MLGAEIPEKSPAGPPLLAEVVRRWEQVIKRGLEEKVKAEIVLKYPIPENFPLLNAPKLNPEVALQEKPSSIQRDGRLSALQHQTGAILAALGSSLTKLLGQDPNPDILQITELVNDAGWSRTFTLAIQLRGERCWRSHVQIALSI